MFLRNAHRLDVQGQCEDCSVVIPPKPVIELEECSSRRCSDMSDVHADINRVSPRNARAMSYLKGVKGQRIGNAQKKSLIFVSTLCFLFIAFGCASPAYRAHPEFGMRVKDIARPGLILSDVKIYELSAGGVVELRDDWCATGKQNLLNAFLEGFKDKRYGMKPLGIDGNMEEEMEEIQALYKAVNRSIQLHSYGPQLFPEKTSYFDYSLGSLEGISQKLGVDSVVFVRGFGQISAVARRTLVSVAVADPSGAILWYCVKGFGGGYDLRDSESTAELVEDILSSFPEVGG